MFRSISCQGMTCGGCAASVKRILESQVSMLPSSVVGRVVRPLSVNHSSVMVQDFDLHHSTILLI